MAQYLSSVPIPLALLYLKLYRIDGPGSRPRNEVFGSLFFSPAGEAFCAAVFTWPAYLLYLTV